MIDDFFCSKNCYHEKRDTEHTAQHLARALFACSFHFDVATADTLDVARFLGLCW